MADILQLQTFAAKANAEAVEILRDTLEKAERGEIVAVAIAAVERDGASLTRASISDYYQYLIGALVILQHRMLVASLDP